MIPRRLLSATVSISGGRGNTDDGGTYLSDMVKGKRALTLDIVVSASS